MSRNALAYGVGHVLSRAMSVVLVILLARRLPVEELGRFSILMTLLGIFEVITVFGMDRIIIAEVAKDPRAGWGRMPAILGLGIALAASSSLALAVLLWASGMTAGSVLLSLVGGACVFPSSVAALLDAAAQGAQRMGVCAAGMITASVTWLTAILISVTFDLGLPAIFIGFLASQCLRGVLLIWASAHSPLARFCSAEWKSILMQAAPYALSAGLGVLVFRQDLLVLVWLKGETAAALYSVSYRFVEVAYFLSSIGLVALVPPMAQLSGKAEQLGSVYATSFKVALLVTVPVAFGVGFAAEDLLRFVFSETYAPAAPILQVHAGVMIAFILHIPGMAVLLSQQCRVALLSISILTTALNLLLNLSLIPSLGPRGAAYAGLISSVAAACLTIYHIRWHVLQVRLDFFRRAIASSLAGAAGMLVATFLCTGYLPPLMQMPIGLGVYGVIALFVDRWVLRNVRARIA